MPSGTHTSRPTRGADRHPRAQLGLGLALAGALTLAVADPAPGDTFSVGPGCTHPTLAAAALAAYFTPADDLIKVTAALTNQSAVFDDFHPTVRGTVTVRGGYTSCADNTPSGRTVVDGTSSNPIVRVKTTSQSQSRVVLENLELRGAERGVAVEAGGQLTLRNVLITANEDGGAQVGPNGTLVTDGATNIFQNGWVATVPISGGGIDCFGGHLDLSGTVDNNRAELGGGISMMSGCTAELRPGFFLETNHATSNGGGLYITGASVLLGNGQWTAILVEGNHANRGGGIYATGSGVVVALSDTYLYLNQADAEGGGVYALGGPEIYLLRDSGCLSGFPCNELYRSQLAADGEGSAVYAYDAYVRLSGQRLSQNQFYDFVPTLQPSMLYVGGPSGELELENLEIWDNRAQYLVRAENHATVRAGYLSSARNSYDLPGGGTANSAVSVEGAVASFNSSILWDHQGFVLSGTTPSLAVDCLIVSTMAGVPAGSQFIATVDPQFLDAAGGDLHLPPSSPAVDYCDEVVYPFPGGPDGDGESRGVDHPANPNGSPGVPGALFDIGFDEVQYPDALVFEDDFESGSTGAWDLTAN